MVKTHDGVVNQLATIVILGHLNEDLIDTARPGNTVSSSGSTPSISACGEQFIVLARCFLCLFGSFGRGCFCEPKFDEEFAGSKQNFAKAQSLNFVDHCVDARKA